MKAQRYREEFQIEALKQIFEHGHSVANARNTAARAGRPKRTIMSLKRRTQMRH